MQIAPMRASAGGVRAAGLLALPLRWIAGSAPLIVRVARMPYNLAARDAAKVAMTAVRTARAGRETAA